MMTTHEKKEQAIANFIKAWDELTMLGLKVVDDDNGQYIDKDDIDIEDDE